MTVPTQAPDLVLRIALLRDDSDLRELSPSIWRSFRCSSAINLDVFQDKILQPIMGWTRNYHTYYFGQGKKYYFQSQTNTADGFGMHDSYRAVGGERLDPTKFVIGDLLKQQGDTCFYAYDLGDHWYHKLTVEQVILENEDDYTNGKCLVLDGAMRCPDEDGEGGAHYQEKVLDLFNKKKANPCCASSARQYARECWERVNSINVSGVFEADDFSVSKTQSSLQEALRSRNPERQGNKQPCMPGQERRQITGMWNLQPGQRRIQGYLQDLRGESGPPHPDRPPFFMSLLEIINVKPDPQNLALCAECGTPQNLKKCSGCSSTWYCSRNCQKSGWKKHKKQCKKDKCLLQEYNNELDGKADVPAGYQAGERVWHRRYDPNNMRFQKGTKVECLIGDGIYGTGKVLEVLHEYDGKVHAYQVQLDRSAASRMGWPYHNAQIWADWDCDYQIREIGGSVSSPSGVNQIDMEFVD